MPHITSLRKIFAETCCAECSWISYTIAELHSQAPAVMRLMELPLHHIIPQSPRIRWLVIQATPIQSSHLTPPT